MSHRPRLMSFNLVVEGEEPAEITVNPEQIESIVDGKPFKRGETTQINMISGTKFFVALPYLEVKDQVKLILGA